MIAFRPLTFLNLDFEVFEVLLDSWLTISKWCAYFFAYSQCEREFHVGCLKEKGIVDLKVVQSSSVCILHIILSVFIMLFTLFAANLSICKCTKISSPGSSEREVVLSPRLSQDSFSFAEVGSSWGTEASRIPPECCKEEAQWKRSSKWCSGYKMEGA